MSVRGSLSTLDVSVNLPQYKLVRGLLVHNLGEPVGLEPTDLIQPHHVPVRGRGEGTEGRGWIGGVWGGGGSYMAGRGGTQDAG